MRINPIVAAVAVGYAALAVAIFIYCFDKPPSVVPVNNLQVLYVVEGVTHLVDTETGCQYLSTDKSMTPRLGPDGLPYCIPHVP